MSAHMQIRSAIRQGLWGIPVAAVLAVLPFLWRGTSNGHDLTFHVNSWIDVAHQWRSGILYPHWAAFANYGSGEPRFAFYPPISWAAGALIGSVLPWQAVPGTLSVLVMIAAGVSMYLFAREWLEESTAIVAAILYAVNPYLLVVIYERGAFAEMIAAVWLPGMLLFALRERGGFARNSLLLGVHVALIWLTNLPAAVIASYLLAVVVLVRAAQTRSFEPLLRAALAMTVGLMLAGFYLVPAVYEQRWVQIGQAVSSGASPRENFLFARTADAEHDAVLLRTSIFAMVESLAALLLVALAEPLRRRAKMLYDVLLGLLVLAVFLMTPLSILFWKYAPKLMYVQFPWRWLLVFNLALVVFAAVALTRKRVFKLSIVVLVPLVIALCYWKFQQPIYPEDRPIALAEAIDSGTGYEGTDEYTPTQADNSKLEPNAPRIAIQIQTQTEEQRKAAPGTLVQSSFQQWEPEKKRLTIDSQVATRDTLRLLDYPAWKVQVDGKAYQPETDEDTGRMLLELPAGHHEVAIDYARTPDRRWGMAISALGLIVTLVLWSLRERKAA